MKSIYVYEFTKVHGPTGYLDESFFTNKTKHKEIIDKANQQKTQRLAHEAYLKHFVNELQQDIPLWAYVDLFTISDISFLYSISEHNAHFYGFLLIMKRILPSDKFSEMKDSIIALAKKYPFVRMDYYGFRNDWQQKL